MASEWQEFRLDEVTDLIADCPHSTPLWTDDGVIVLRNQNIRNGRLDLSSPSYTNEKGYQDRIKRANPTAGDIVFTREAPMGEVCLIPEKLRCCLGQRMVLLRVNKNRMNSRYLLYAFQSQSLRNQINWNEGTGTTVSNIRIPNIKAFKILTPPIEEQKTIAHILGSLDDKIELNRQMNATLEAMAQALFKSWFVDFDPVLDNALAAGNPIPDELADK
jgi:type I restriction enzyme S subunit